MKKILFVFMLILLATIQPASTQAAEGDPIWTKTSNPSVGTDYAHALVVDSTGLYVAGIDATPPVAGDVQWRIEKRSLVNGDPIWTKTIDPSGGWDRISALAVDSTGLYAAGWDSAPSIGDFQWRIEKRSLVNGDPIWTKTVNPSASWDTAFALAVDGTGLYAAGMDSNPGNFQWRIEKRSLVNGDPIWTKTVNPYNIATGFTFETVYALAVDGTGLYAAGMDLAPGNNQWRIEKRSLVNGDPIWAKTSNPSSSHDGAYALAVDGTGLYVAGADAVPGNNQWRIEKRSLVNGDPIWTKTSNPSSSSDEPYALAVDSTGLYAAGIDIVAVPGNIQWRIEKREICPACSAVPPSPSILQLCRDGVPVAQGGGTYDFSLSTGTTTNIKAYYDADATSGHQCDAGSTDVTAFVTFTETDSTGGALSLSANGTNPKVFTGASAGAETVTVSYSGQTVTMNATVTCVETVNCAPEKSAVCTGSTVPSGTVKVGTCGNVDCSGEQGTRFCDFNWKEVAPGQ